MLFRRIILTAICVGLVAGLLLTVIQQLQVAPIIFAAESYETWEQSGQQDHSDDHNHRHDEAAWSPRDGAERMFYSFVSNTLIGIAFAVIMLALMSQLQIHGITRISAVKGIAWGIAGFAVFFAAPGVGLPPEIPGINAAQLEHRQAWWLFTAAATAVGIGLIFFASGILKILGGALIVLPHLVGAPQPSGPEFSHPDPGAVAGLNSLHHDFIIASAVTNLVFWVVLGIISAWALNRWIMKDLEIQA